MPSPRVSQASSRGVMRSVQSAATIIEVVENRLKSKTDRRRDVMVQRCWKFVEIQLFRFHGIYSPTISRRVSNILSQYSAAVGCWPRVPCAHSGRGSGPGTAVRAHPWRGIRPLLAANPVVVQKRSDRGRVAQLGRDTYRDDHRAGAAGGADQAIQRGGAWRTSQRGQAKSSNQRSWTRCSRHAHSVENRTSNSVRVRG